MIDQDPINRENTVPVIYVKDSFFMMKDQRFQLINWNGEVEFPLISQDPLSTRNLQVWMVSE